MAVTIKSVIKPIHEIDNNSAVGVNSHQTAMPARIKHIRNGNTPNFAAFRYLLMTASEVCSGSNPVACANKKPEKTKSSPAKETEPPSTARMMSLVESISCGGSSTHKGSAQQLIRAIPT